MTTHIAESRKEKAYAGWANPIFREVVGPLFEQGLTEDLRAKIIETKYDQRRQPVGYVARLNEVDLTICLMTGIASAKVSGESIDDSTRKNLTETFNRYRISLLPFSAEQIREGFPSFYS